MNHVEVFCCGAGGLLVWSFQQISWQPCHSLALHASGQWVHGDVNVTTLLGGFSRIKTWVILRAGLGTSQGLSKGNYLFANVKTTHLLSGR